MHFLIHKEMTSFFLLVLFKIALSIASGCLALSGTLGRTGDLVSR